MKFSAVIFDFDGVIVDSERYWFQAEYDSYAKLVPNWTKELNAQVVGMAMSNTHTLLVEQCGLDMSIEHFLEFSDGIAQQAYKHSQAIPGVHELIHTLKAQEKKVAIGTSSFTRWIQPVLKRIELAEAFDTIVTADQLPAGRGKPKPDIFLEAAHRLDRAPEQCMVIEDSINGIKAAKNSNMYCIALRSEWNASVDLSGADVVITQLSEVEEFLR